MNLLETVILHIFLVLFSMPSKPTPGDEVDTKSGQTCGVEYNVEYMKYTRIRLEEDDPAAVDSSAEEKVHSNGGTIVSHPSDTSSITSSKPKIDKRARILLRPSIIIIPD
jgi:hypothetical protein